MTADRAGHGHPSGWSRVIDRSYGHRSLHLWICREENPSGILPLIIVRSPLRGCSLVSLPFLDEGCICAEDADTVLALYQEAVRQFPEQKADYLDLRHPRPSVLEISSAGSKVTLALTLADDPDRMWHGLNAKLRNQTRLAQKSGWSEHLCGIESLAEFYDVFATNMRDLGLPVHSRDFFAQTLMSFRRRPG